MNKTNKQKLKKYNQLQAQAAKLPTKQAQLDQTLSDAANKIAEQVRLYEAKLTRKLQPLRKKLDHHKQLVSDNTDALKALRSEFFAKDNPDRHELLNILLED